jgi:hypothetical protein
LPANTITQSYSDRALRVSLPDDMLIKLGNDLTRRHLIELKSLVYFTF